MPELFLLHGLKRDHSKCDQEKTVDVPKVKIVPTVVVKVDVVVDWVGTVEVVVEIGDVEGEAGDVLGP